MRDARRALGPVLRTCAALAGLSVSGAPAAGATTAVGAPAGPQAGSAQVVARARYVMGSPLEVRAFALAERRDEIIRALDAALDEVERLDGVLSNWREDSELSRLNRSAAREPVVCSEDLFEALRAALQAEADTGGAFDPTLDPWISALGLRHEDGGAEPPPPARADADAPTPAAGGVPRPALPARAGEVRLDPIRRQVAFTGDRVGVDLGGIGKGYALDRAARVLRAGGVTSALLNFGGQVLALGAPPGESGWQVEVADPADRMRPAVELRIRDASVSTSSNTERGVWRNGRWIGHVLDPSSGEPAPYPGSATAVAPDATRADAYSTALLVLGPEHGLEWAADRAGIAALYLEPTPGGQVRVRATASLEAYREGNSQPRASR